MKFTCNFIMMWTQQEKKDNEVNELNSPLVLVLYPRSPPVQVRAFFHCSSLLMTCGGERREQATGRERTGKNGGRMVGKETADGTVRWQMVVPYAHSLPPFHLPFSSVPYVSLRSQWRKRSEWNEWSEPHVKEGTRRTEVKGWKGPGTRAFMTKPGFARTVVTVEKLWPRAVNPPLVLVRPYHPGTWSP